jgi:RimJ/RimL family protein N-acetyltransferase
MNIVTEETIGYNLLGTQVSYDIIYIDQVDGSRSFVVRSGLDRIPIGFAAINDKDQGEGLYIAPKYRKKHLATDLAMIMRNKGMKEVHVHFRNKASIRLCEKCGFKKVDEFEVKGEKFYKYGVQ